MGRKRYERITRDLRLINENRGPGTSTGAFAALSEVGMFAYGVENVFTHPGFWVIVWKVAEVTLGGKKQGKTTFWQRVDKE